MISKQEIKSTLWLTDFVMPFFQKKMEVSKRWPFCYAFEAIMYIYASSIYLGFALNLL